MTFTNTQLLNKCEEGVLTDVRVTFTAELLTSFMSVFAGYQPEDVSDDCVEGEVSYQMFYPIQDKVTEWVQDKNGDINVTTCYTLHDEDDLSYCDIYIDNQFSDGKFTDWSADYDDTFGDTQLVC